MRQRTRQQIDHRQPARRLAHDGDVAGIAAERGDVLLDPFERCDLVEQTVIARYAVGRLRAQFRMRHPAQYPQPVVDRDEDDAALGEIASVIERLPTSAEQQPAAVNPDDDGRLLGMRGRPHIQEQTILTELRRIVGIDAVLGPGRRNAAGAELSRVARAGPAGRGNGRGPSFVADRGRSIGNGFEGLHTIRVAPPGQCALHDGDNRRGCGLLWRRQGLHGTERSREDQHAPHQGF